ncbi:MAG TPA: hypothetical protein VJ373_00635 [Desulfatiglandales bacterium]|nr:hypothetical protein [Desulfatiglandales bacterium]
MKRSAMDEKEILNQLEELAKSLGIIIRYEQLLKEGSFFPGGLCRIKGEDILIINSMAGIDDKIETLAKAVVSFDLSKVYMRPALREFLSKNSPDKI